MSLEDDALRIAMDPAATAWFEFENAQGELDPHSEWHNYLRDLSKPEGPVALTIFPAVKALIAAGMLVDIEAVKALHHPIDGYNHCWHHDDGETCPTKERCMYVETDRHPHGIWLRPTPVCEHCLVTDDGVDLPSWISEAEVAIIEHPIHEMGWHQDMWHRIWPCPTATALGLS